MEDIPKAPEGGGDVWLGRGDEWRPWTFTSYDHPMNDFKLVDLLTDDDPTKAYFNTLDDQDPDLITANQVIRGLRLGEPNVG